MTRGSPSASAAASPGVDETKAICLESGDQAALLPCPGSGLLVPFISAKKVMPEPSARDMSRPCLPVWLPKKARDLPSGDHIGPPAASLSPPTREDFCVARSMIQSWL